MITVVTSSPISLLILLLGGHALADYPLQGDFLAKGKNHRLAECACGKEITRIGRKACDLCWGPIDKPYEVCVDNHWHAPLPHFLGWQKSMLAHCLIHAMFVYLFTGHWQLALAELVIHGITDWAKCDGRISSNTDQAIHYGCKILWWLAVIG